MASEDDETNSLLFDFGTGEPNIVNLDQDYEDDSDGTLLGDEFEDRFVNPTPEIDFVRAEHSNRLSDNDVERWNTLSRDGRTYKPGKTVELRDKDFLRITAIIPDHITQSVSLKGIKFRRNKELGGLMEFKMNEVTMLLEYDENDPRDVYHQSLKIVQLEEVIKIRKLVKTNQPFPAFSFREADPNFRTQGKDYVMEHGQLVCRTRQVMIGKNEGYLQVLRDVEADEGYAMDDKELRCRFRGATKKGGASNEWLEGERSFDRNERARCANIDLLRFHRRMPLDNNLNKPRYTFADAFCGAGGASRGAKEAGLRVDWGFDYDPAAINSYRRNFYGTRCEAVPVHEFVTVLTEDYQVDILHLSPPCQPFSPMHTRPGKNDELNQATFLAIAELITKVKPRIITLEETFGLTRQIDALPWFTAMIQMFTKLAFSVRWKVYNLCDFGLPQPRKRLIIFASCPGEVLPEFPSATHCKAADLYRFPQMSRFATVHDAIADIPQGFPLHNPKQMAARNDPPYNENLPLRNTICCGGGPISHPSGKRPFTNRELACLQGFPLEHQFGPSRARKQIGNAYPPIVAKVFFEAIIKTLLKTDGLTGRINGAPSSQQPSSSRHV